MGRIRPHLWYATEAEEAANLYTSTFPDSKVTDVTVLHDTPSGDCPVVSFELFRQPFLAISAGDLFTFTPAISFLVACTSEDEVDAYWRALSHGGEALMPLDAYPFSKRYGWTQDRFGLSWQIMLADREVEQRITPVLMFTRDVAGKAEEAIGFYTSVFRGAEAGDLMRYGKGEEPEAEGTIKFASFTLEGQSFAAMDSAGPHDFGFNEAVSLLVNAETQDEIDYYWNKLSAVPESEQCGWLKDRYGVSWQISPAELGDMLSNGSPEQVARVTQTFLPMKKLVLAELRRAYEGS